MRSCFVAPVNKEFKLFRMFSAVGLLAGSFNPSCVVSKTIRKPAF